MSINRIPIIIGAVTALDEKDTLNNIHAKDTQEELYINETERPARLTLHTD